MGVLLVSAVGVGGWLAVPVPPDVLRPGATLRLLDRSGEQIASVGSKRARACHPIPMAEMGGRLPELVILLEDRRFREHGGVDVGAIIRAAWRNVWAGRVVSGGSTITQQLVKLARGEPPRTLREKAVEAVAAIKLEAVADKEKILEAYLNRLPFGNRLMGPEAAALWYYGKPANRLSLAESIYLAGIPQAPTRFNPRIHPAGAEGKYRRSLDRLEAIGYLEKGEADRLRGSVPAVGWQVPGREAPHFVGHLLAERGGLRGDVGTTLDLGRQREVESLVRMHLALLNRRDVTNAGVVVVENDTGAVRVMVGSADPARWETNVAVSYRAAGSVLKPFVYGEGIERGAFTAATVLPDTAEVCRRLFPDYEPQNFSGRWHGPVRVREALGNSLNVPAVVALARVGPRVAFSALRQWGVRFPAEFDTYGAGLVLGNGEIRLLDLAGAYAGLARGGLAMAPTLLRGESGPMTRLVSREAASIVGDMLCDNRARLRSFGPNSVLNLGGRIAVKTGTSSHFKDAWTVGYGRRYTVAVWVGNFDGRPMDEMASVDAAAPLWAAVTRRFLAEDEPLRELPGGLALERVEIDPLTGLLPVSGGPEGVVAEWFLRGTAPKADARGEYETVEGRRRLVLSSDYSDWCAGGFNGIGAVARISGRALKILSPRDGALFRIERYLPVGQQMIPLRVAGAVGEPRWKVNGVPVETGRRGESLWALMRGEWEFEVAADGVEARSRVRVE
jgi:penicillin-binding protein 1C